MAGDATNVDLWQDTDVYIGPLNATEPTTVTEAWDGAWDLVGLLDGEEGFTEAREDETSEKYAWGGLLVKKTRGKHKRTIKFVALEDNATTFALANPGSVRSGTSGYGTVQTSTVEVPRYAEMAVGLETREGEKVVRRIIPTADVELTGEVKASESDVTVYEFTVTIIPDSDGVLYIDLEGLDPAGS